jgi:hypothetical protein
VDGGEYIVPLVYTVWLRGKLVTGPVPAEDDVPPEGVPLLVAGELVQAPMTASPSSPAAAMAAAFAGRHRALFLVGLTVPTSSIYRSSLSRVRAGCQGRMSETRRTKDVN